MLESAPYTLFSAKAGCSLPQIYTLYLGYLVLLNIYFFISEYLNPARQINVNKVRGMCSCYCVKITFPNCIYGMESWKKLRKLECFREWSSHS